MWPSSVLDEDKVSYICQHLTRKGSHHISQSAISTVVFPSLNITARIQYLIEEHQREGNDLAEWKDPEMTSMRSPVSSRPQTVRSHGSDREKSYSMLEDYEAEIFEGETESFLHRLRHPASAERRGWTLLILLIVVYNAVAIPLRFSFHTLWHRTDETVFIMLDYLGDAVLIADMVLSMHSPYINVGFLVTDPELVRHHYLRGWFGVDLLAALPIDLISFVTWKHALLRMPKLLRMLKYRLYYRIWEKYSVVSNRLIRFIQLVMGLVLVFHWVGCIYIAFGYWKGFDGEWLPLPEAEHSSFQSQYLYGFFWATNIVTGEGGAVERPTTDFERAVTVMIAFLSVFLVATIIGHVEQIIEHLGKDAEAFRRKMHSLNVFMQSRKLPTDLQERVRSYYINVLQYRQGSDDNAVLDQLPASLRTQTLLAMNHGLISKVPLFKEFTNPFINALVSHLRNQVYQPGDFVTKLGDFGSEMFFIQSGRVSVVNAEEEVVCVLTEGAFFGEVALFEPHCRRTATVQCLSFCDMMVLTRESLDVVLSSFPHEKRTMKRAAHIRTARDTLRTKLLSEELFKDSSDEFVSELGKSFKDKTVDPDSVLFRAGEEANMFYFIARGGIYMFKAKKEERGKKSNKVTSQKRKEERERQFESAAEEEKKRENSDIEEEDESDVEQELEDEDVGEEEEQEEGEGEEDEGKVEEEKALTDVPLTKNATGRSSLRNRVFPHLKKLGAFSSKVGGGEKKQQQRKEWRRGGNVLSRRSRLSQMYGDLVCKLHEGLFFGSIGFMSFTSMVSAMMNNRSNDTHTLTAKASPETDTILFYLDLPAVSALAEKYPDEKTRLQLFLRKYRSFKTVAASKLMQLLTRSHSQPLPLDDMNNFLTQAGFHVQGDTVMSPVSTTSSRGPKDDGRSPPMSSDSHSASQTFSFKDSDSSVSFVDGVEGVHNPLYEEGIVRDLYLMYTENTRVELGEMTMGELLLATEGLQALQLRLSRQLFMRQTNPISKADAVSDGSRGG